MEKKDILDLVKEKNVVFIRLQFTDILSIPKNVEIPVAELESALDNGILFDGSSIEGFVRIQESDMLLLPDPDTFTILPWTIDGGVVGRFICDVLNPDGTPFLGDPRYILKRELKKVKDEFGYVFNTGPETEFFLFKRDANGRPTTITHDHGSYFDLLPIDLGEKVREEIVTTLKEMGFEIETSHHEVAEGQHEIDFRYSDALRTADNVITFKLVTKTIALKYGLHATFMPKPVYGINGSGMHTHLSLFKGDENIFYDKNGKYELSKEALYFIGGIFKHAKGICFIANPLINSYKRIVPGYEAPVYISWALRNRSALIRVPAATGKYRRIEFRSPDPSCNPYLAFSVILAAGIDGIRNNIDPGEPTNIDIYNLSDDERKKRGIDSLPGSLMEAKEQFLKDKVLIDSLSEHIIEKFIEAKNEEWDSFRTHITNWELDRFLEIY
ncbi:MAG TPA: type I glutamate--ammonia ligase [Caldisericia bacterium]|nr:type I glutamate--ammonia ligase [Caldisericia bacterium]